MTVVHVRPMRAEDIPRVQEIDRLAFAVPWPPSAFPHELRHSPHSRLWVAEMDGEVVGFVVVWLIVDEAHIATIAVHPDFRQQGIARRLLETAIQSAREEGAVLATLEVRAGNTAAQALYRQMGFAVVGRRPRYYTDNGEDALIMTLKWRTGGETHER